MPRNFLAPHEPDYALKVAVIYQDQAGCQWAHEICDRVQHAIGANALRVETWSTEELNGLDPWCRAVEAASEADIIVLAVSAEGPLRPDVGIWLETALSHRHAPAGALVALVSVPDRPGARQSQVQQSLQEIGRMSRLDFILQERLVAAETTDAPESPCGDVVLWSATPPIPFLQGWLSRFHSKGTRAKHRRLWSPQSARPPSPRRARRQLPAERQSIVTKGLKR